MNTRQIDYYYNTPLEHKYDDIERKGNKFNMKEVIKTLRRNYISIRVTRQTNIYKYEMYDKLKYIEHLLYKFINLKLTCSRIKSPNIAIYKKISSNGVRPDDYIN